MAEAFAYRASELDLEPGVVGMLHAGDRTVWRVHETLRKVFQVTVAE